jgi:hypothetical protein
MSFRIPTFLMVRFDPLPVSGSSFPGTLKTSMCAIRLFPTARMPGKKLLQPGRWRQYGLTRTSRTQLEQHNA